MCTYWLCFHFWKKWQKRANLYSLSCHLDALSLIYHLKKSPQREGDFIGGNVAQTLSGVLWVKANCFFLSLFWSTKIRHYTYLFFQNPYDYFIIFLWGLVTTATKCLPHPLWPLSSGLPHSMVCPFGGVWGEDVLMSCIQQDSACTYCRTVIFCVWGGQGWLFVCRSLE